MSMGGGSSGMGGGEGHGMSMGGGSSGMGGGGGVTDGDDECTWNGSANVQYGERYATSLL